MLNLKNKFKDRGKSKYRKKYLKILNKFKSKIVLLKTAFLKPLVNHFYKDFLMN